MKPIGVVIPTRWEAGALIRTFRFKRAGHSLFKSIIAGRAVFLCVSGVGGEAGRRAAEHLAAEGAGELISMGFCGALVPELKVGDLVTHRLATVDHAVRTPDERRDLASRANAVAADMETQAIIEAGTRLGLPIRVRRVVSDEFEHDLTPLFGAGGTFSAWRIAIRLLNPAAWPLAWRLRRQSAIAQDRLAEALRGICADEAPSASLQ